jgi:hypothetical protein
MGIRRLKKVHAGQATPTTACNVRPKSVRGKKPRLKQEREKRREEG